MIITALLSGFLGAVECASLFAEAQSHLAAAQEARAQQTLTLFVEDACPIAEGYLYLGTLLRNKQELTEAIEIFRAGLHVDEQHTALRCELAMTLAWKELRQESIQEYDQVLAVYPAHRAARLGRARVLAWDERFDLSLKVYEDLLSEYPDDVEVLRGVASVHRATYDLRRAEESYRLILAQNPNDQDALEGLRAVENESLLRLLVGGGAISAPEGQIRGLAELGLTLRIDHRLELAAIYDSRTSGYAHGVFKRNWGHRGQFGAVWGATSRLKLQSSYELRSDEGGVNHRVLLRPSYRLNRKVTLLAGTRVGLIPEGPGQDWGVDAGIQWFPLTKLWWMGQFYVSVFRGERSVTAVATAGLEPLEGWGIRGGIGVGVSDRANSQNRILTLFASVCIPVTTDAQLQAGYERLHQPFSQHTARVALVVGL